MVDGHVSICYNTSDDKQAAARATNTGGGSDQTEE
jgi:hypothetical protein